MRFLSLLLVIACALFLIQGASARTASQTLSRDLDPVVVMGQSFPGFSSVGLTQLFLYAYRAGAWSQIPWQFDEVKLGIIVASEDNKLDGDDQLVFMAADSGDQAPAADWISDASSRQYPRYEIVVTDPTNASQRGWAYLYRSTTLANSVSQDYVNYDAGQSLVRANEYLLRLPRGKVGLDRLELHGSGVSIMERTKLRALVPAVGMVTEDSLPISIGTLALLRDGRVRVVASIRVGISDRVLFIGYRSRFDYVVREPVPIAPTWARMSGDLTAAASGSTYYDANTVAGVSIDGVPDSIVTSPASNWHQISGSTGTYLVIDDWPGGTTASTYYKDDKTVDANDTGDKMSYADAGLYISQPGTLISFSLAGYILPPNQPRVGPTYEAYFRQPLQAQASQQRYSSSGTVTAQPSNTPTHTPTRTATSVPSSTPTRTPTSTATSVPSGTPTRTSTSTATSGPSSTPTRTLTPTRTPVWAHRVFLPVVIKSR